MKLKLKRKTPAKAAEKPIPLPTSDRKPYNNSFEVTDEVLSKMSTLAASGLNLEQIAHCFDISYETLHARAKEDSRIHSSIKGGRAKAVAMVANRLYNDALKEENLGAQIFYLKQNGFKDGQALEVTGKDGGPLEMMEVKLTPKERAAKLLMILNAARDRKPAKA